MWSIASTYDWILSNRNYKRTFDRSTLPCNEIVLISVVNATVGPLNKGHIGINYPCKEAVLIVLSQMVHFLQRLSMYQREVVQCNRFIRIMTRCSIFFQETNEIKWNSLTISFYSIRYVRGESIFAFNSSVGFPVLP